MLRTIILALIVSFSLNVYAFSKLQMQDKWIEQIDERVQIAEQNWRIFRLECNRWLYEE
jgi:hypothetical protein